MSDSDQEFTNHKMYLIHLFYEYVALHNLKVKGLPRLLCFHFREFIYRGPAIRKLGSDEVDANFEERDPEEFFSWSRATPDDLHEAFSPVKKPMKSFKYHHTFQSEVIGFDVVKFVSYLEDNLDKTGLTRIQIDKLLDYVPEKEIMITSYKEVHLIRSGTKWSA